MNTQDQKLLSRWLPRLGDRSQDVRISAIENLSEIAVRNAELRSSIAPKLIHLAKKEEEWVVLSNGFLRNASTIPEFDANWAEDFYEAYLVIAKKNIEIASGNAFERMLALLLRRTIDANNPLVISSNDLALSLLKGGGNEYIRDALFALTDWYEDQSNEAAVPGEDAPDNNASSFEWPTTSTTLTYGQLEDDVFPLEIGVLRTIGYAVGLTNGLQPDARRILLSNFFTATPHLPAEHPQAGEWGGPNSAARLLKLANTIAAHTRNAKRRRHRPEVAIADWESDLAFLKCTYFDGELQFQWPSTTSV